MLNETKRLTIAEVARTLEVEPAALAAVVEVESGGRVQALVEGKPEPLIRFEGHYFDRRLAATGASGRGRKGSPHRRPASSATLPHKPHAGRCCGRQLKSTARPHMNRLRGASGK